MAALNVMGVTLIMKFVMFKSVPIVKHWDHGHLGSSIVIIQPQVESVGRSDFGTFASSISQMEKFTKRKKRIEFVWIIRAIELRKTTMISILVNQIRGVAVHQTVAVAYNIGLMERKRCHEIAIHIHVKVSYKLIIKLNICLNPKTPLLLLFTPLCTAIRVQTLSMKCLILIE